MKNKNIWFVIVTYKPNAKGLRQLTSVLFQYHVIIIDNTKKNLGYGGAANQGMKRAFDAGATWAIICNQDISLTKIGIAKFVKALEHASPGIVGPEAGELEPNRWTTVLASRHIRQAQCKPGLEARSVHYVSGSFMAIHRNVWGATQGFYEPYFMYYEDVDLSVRVRKAGFQLQKVVIDGFEHGLGNKPGKEGWIPDQVGDDRQMKEYYLARNHLLFVRRLAPLSVKIHELFRLPKSIAEHHANTNREALEGVADFARSMFGKRKQIS